jgi:hypothetical protein
VVTFLTPLAAGLCDCFQQVTKGSIGPAFAVVPHTEGPDQASFCPFTLREVSVLTELALGHLRYLLIDVPPQSNSPPATVSGRGPEGSLVDENRPPPLSPKVLCSVATERVLLHRISKETMRVVVFHWRLKLPPTLHLTCLSTESD